MNKLTESVITKLAAGGKWSPAAKGGAIAAEPDDKKASLVDHILEDLVRGAQRNHRTGEIDLNRSGEESKLASITYIESAKLAGAARALHEAGFSTKEASASLGLSEVHVTELLESIR